MLKLYYFLNFTKVYLADGTKLKDREPVYNEDLGLAVERLPENYTISDLWKIIPERKKDK